MEDKIKEIMEEEGWIESKEEFLINDKFEILTIYHNITSDELFKKSILEKIWKEAQKEILKDFNICIDREDYKDTEKKWNNKLFPNRI